MTGSIADRARGLVDTNELAESPGALTVATNVVVEPGGTLAVRPTFVLDDSPSATEKPRTIVALGDNVGVVKTNAGTYGLWYGGGNITGALEPPSNVDEHPWCYSRGSLYIQSDEGSRKYDGAAVSLTNAGIECDIVFNRAFLMGSFGGLGATAKPWTGLAAYRLVVRRKDANGYVLRSRPSQRYVAQENAIGGTSLAGSSLSTRYYFRGLVQGDVIEWYRSRGSGAVDVVPAASCYLVCEYTITADDIVNGYFYNTAVDFDTLADEDLGPALYTNPERDGIEKAKYPPPIARTVAVWNRCAWHGDTTSQQRISASIRSVGIVQPFSGDTTSGTNTITNVPSIGGLAVDMYVCDSNNSPRVAGTHFAAATRITAISAGPAPYTVTVSANASASTAGVGFGACNWYNPSLVTSLNTGSGTIGTNTISVSNASGIQADMYVWDGSTPTPFTAGTYTAASTRVVSVSGAGPYTITLSNNLLATAASATFEFGDFVTISSVDYVASYAGQYGPGPAPISTATRLFSCGPNDTPGTVAMWLAQCVNYDAVIANRGWRVVPTSSETAYGALTAGDFTIEEYGLGAAAFDLEGNLSSFSPLAFWPNLTGAITSSNDRATNRVMWSAPDEPEAVPLPNFVDLATSSAIVQRLVPLRASLLAFTTEGLYRIAGTPPDGWAVDLIDPTIRLVSRDTADVIDGTAYAWTTRGVIAVDESGFVDVSTGAIGKALTEYVADGAGTTAHVFVATWKARHLVLVGAGTDTNNGETTEVFCFNTLSRAWSSWDIAYRRLLEVGSLLYAVRGDRFDIEYARNAPPFSMGYDRSHTISVWTYTAGATTVTIATANLGAWRHRDGDYLRATIGGAYVWRRIVSSEVSGANRIFTISRAFTSATITALVAYDVASVDLEWTPATAGALQGFHQRWREGCVTLDVSGYDGNGTSTATQAHEIEPAFGAQTSMVPETTTRKLIALTQCKTLPLRFAVVRMLSRASVIWPRFKGGFVGWPARIFGVTMQRLGASEKVHR